MKEDKAPNDFQTSSHSSEEKATQAGAQQPNQPQAELHESPNNLLKSYHMLRKFDEDLAESKSEKEQSDKNPSK